jgi:hypothetical protein
MHACRLAQRADSRTVTASSTAHANPAVHEVSRSEVRKEGLGSDELSRSGCPPRTPATAGREAIAVVQAARVPSAGPAVGPGPAVRSRPDRHVPACFWSIIGEAALRTPVGGVEVMRDQLAHLTEMVKRPNITLQVLPYSVGAHAGLSGPFVIFGFNLPGDSGVVFLENLSSSLYLETDEEVIGYTLVFDDLRSSALNPADSLDCIAAIAGELGTKETKR